MLRHSWRVVAKRFHVSLEARWFAAAHQQAYVRGNVEKCAGSLNRPDKDDAAAVDVHFHLDGQKVEMMESRLSIDIYQFHFLVVVVDLSARNMLVFIDVAESYISFLF